MRHRATHPTRRQASAWLLAGSALPLAGYGTAVLATGSGSATPPDIVVAQDGSGQFRSVQAAVQSVPKDNRERLVVYVKDGVYAERVRIDAPFVTLRGQSRSGTRIEFARAADVPADANGRAVLDIGPQAHDCVVEQLTVHNTHPVMGQHAFAVLGRADRTVIQDCDILGIGNDTLSLWRNAAPPEDLLPGAALRPAHGGRYYHARLKVSGSVDFVCPRGWCYMADSTLLQVNAGASASMWHDGRGHADKKFVMRRCHFDGPPGFTLARRHQDGQFIFVDCRFTATMRDRAPYRVDYPQGGDAPHLYGDRNAFWNCHREGGDFDWHRDNLARVPGLPAAGDITARWTFGGSWDPENPAGPVLLGRRLTRDALELEFSEAVTAKGPAVLQGTAGAARLLGGSGSTRLVWEPTAGSGPLRLVSGLLVASEASAAWRLAQLA